jgi:integrase
MATIYRREIVDPVTCEKKPGKFWWISYMENGRQLRRSLKVTSKKMAELAKADVEENLERGTVGLPKQSVDTLKILSEFQTDMIEKTSPSWSLRMKQLFEPFVQFVLANDLTNLVRITTRRIEEHLNGRSDAVGPKTWNEELRIIKRFFRFAVQREYIVRDPAEAIAKRYAEKPSVEILTPKELELIFKYAAKVSLPFYKILLYTGLRDGELRHLQWKDVDLTLDREHVKVRSTPEHRTKNRKDRIVPLSFEAIQVFKDLKEHRKSSSPYVFHNRRGTPKVHLRNTWIDLLDRIERHEGIRIDKGRHMTGLHLFRHTFATNALASGIDIRTVQEWLGHSSIVQTQRYLNLLPEHKHQQIKKLKIAIGEK